MSRIEKLKVLLADTYAIYLKTQNYHWHVKGIHFKPLHVLFEEHYTELADAVDEIAERILILGEKAPATFSEYNELKTLSDGSSDFNADGMISDLSDDHQKLVALLNEVLSEASEASDEGTVALCSDRIAAHEKMRWMLSASETE